MAEILAGTPAGADDPVTVPTSDGDQPERPREGFRPDIQGLRAIAVVLIVAYHAGIPGFGGGSVGVDVFFVISGYLITRHLLRGPAPGDTVDFGEFWARRVRRLVPALGLMVAITLLASLVIITPFDMLETAKEGGSAALYVSNFLFAQNAQDYFGSNPNKSPFLHTWSLGVEEQFYLIWPFLVFGILWIGRRRDRLRSRAAVALFASVFVVSFALNLRLTGEGSSWAFFGLPTRAWEFAAGGLLGVLMLGDVGRRRLQALAGVVGLIVLIVATESLNSTSAYPGANALLPVAGTALLIWAGAGAHGASSPVTRAISIRPMQWTGRMSYSWYLWHWPFIVLVVLELGNDSTIVRTGAAAASLVAAYLALHYVEDPLRLHPKLLGSMRRTFVVGLAITVTVLGIAGTTWVYSSRRTPSSFNQQVAVATQNFLPSCRKQSTATGAFYCFGGDLSSSTTVALVGDSHAATWFNALAHVAARQGVRILLLTEPGCPFIPISTLPEPNGGVTTGHCSAFRLDDAQILSTVRPAAIILTQHSGVYLGSILDASGTIPSRNDQVKLWKGAFAAFLDNMDERGIRAAVILDNPTLPQSPAECVSRTGSIAACEPSRTVALAPSRPLVAVEEQVLQGRRGIPVFDPNHLLCTTAGCPLELDGRLAYVDTNHLAFSATEEMEPQLAELLRTLVDLVHSRVSG